MKWMALSSQIRPDAGLRELTTREIDDFVVLDDLDEHARSVLARLERALQTRQNHSG